MTTPAIPTTAPVAAPAAAPVQAQGTALDPTIVNLAKAIRQTETRGQADPYTAKGASGEYGAYQYTDGTWAADSKKYLGKSVPLTSATKEQQNEVAYKKIADLKAAGNNVGQIASIWNSGQPDWKGKVGVNKFGVKYDVPTYVNSVANTYQSLKTGQTPIYKDTASTVGKEQRVTPEQQADEAGGTKTGAFFPSSTSDSPLTSGLKAAGNLIPSAFNFAKGVVNTLNPVNTIGTIAQIPGAFSGLVKDAGGVGNAIGAAAKEVLPTAYQTLVPEAARDLVKGDIVGAQRSVVNDPFGQVAQFVLGAKGAAEGVDAATGAISKAKTADYVKNIGENVANDVPIPKGGTNFGGAVDSAVKGIASPVIKGAQYAFGKAADVARGGKPLTASEISQEVLQNDIKTREAGARVLPSIRMNGVKTYEDFHQRMQKETDANQTLTDAEYAKETAPVKLDSLTQRTPGATPVNYVKESLNGLKELYTKTIDVKGQAWVNQIIAKAKKDGLTPSDINEVAKKYGGEFGSKAFSKTGDPLTSVNAQRYENVRTGVKETARSFLKTDEAKLLDRKTSDMIRVTTAVKKVAEAVNKLDGRLQRRGLLTRVGRAIGAITDVATGGLLKGFLQKFLIDSNVGNKTFNHAALEENLSTNLKRLQHLDRVNDGTLVSMMVQALKTVNNLPEGKIIQGSVFGRRPQQLQETNQ